METTNFTKLLTVCLSHADTRAWCFGFLAGVAVWVFWELVLIAVTKTPKGQLAEFSNNKANLAATITSIVLTTMSILSTALAVTYVRML